MNLKPILRFSFLLVLLFWRIGAWGQTDTSPEKKSVFQFSGFLDLFFVYDFNEPKGNIRQPFFFNHNRHNNLNLNLGYVRATMKSSRFRANLGLQAGTYVKDNYANEPNVLKIFQEANLGFSLNSKGNLWLDAGILSSHIGFESAVSLENLTLTRSILAENSPYFETGGKLTFNPNEKWEMAALVLTGWQRIRPAEGNSIPSLGTQLKFSPSQNSNLNWSSFIGTDDPDSERRIRIFNNFYGTFQLSQKVILITGFDIGLQQIVRKSSDYSTWLSPVVIGQFLLNNNLKVALRAEFYQDPTGILIPIEPPNEFKTTGLSMNLDFSPYPNSALRIEARWLKSQDEVLGPADNLSDEDFFIGTSIAFKVPMKK